MNDDLQKLLQENAELRQNNRILEKEQNVLGLTYKTQVETGDTQRLLKNEIPLLKRVDELSVVKNDTEPDHLLIEGDNISSLTILQQSHRNKVDVIYIDPPYNTGNEDFVYNDKFVKGDDGFRHSKWLSFMKVRLSLAKTLLKDTGVIFVSIDDHEQAYLKILMDEIFGEENFIANVIYDGGLKNNSRFISVGHDYILVYVKSKSTLIENNVIWREEKKGIPLFKKFISKLQETNDTTENKQKKLRTWLERQELKKTLDRGLLAYNLIDDNGVFTSGDLSSPSGNGYQYEVLHPITHKPVKEPTSGWRFSKSSMKQNIDEDKIIFGKDETTVPRLKRILTDDGENDLQVARSYFWSERSNANKALKDILGENVFNYPKGVDVLKRWISLVSDKDSIVLDFFAGSGTTGQAVAELNAEDGGTRQTILCTNNFEQDGSKNGIARGITAVRMKRVLTGQDWNDDKDHAPLPGNLIYYRVEFDGSISEDVGIDERISPEDYAERAEVSSFSGVVSLLTGSHRPVGMNVLKDVGKAVSEAVRAGEAEVLTSPDTVVLIYGDFPNAEYLTDEFEKTVEEVRTYSESLGRKFISYIISDQAGNEAVLDGEGHTGKAFPLPYLNGVRSTVEKAEKQGLIVRQASSSLEEDDTDETGRKIEDSEGRDEEATVKRTR